MLGIVESLKEFWPWVSGTILPVSIIMDHKDLEYFMTTWQLNWRQAWWALELTEYNFKLSWAPGSKNLVDGPLRCPNFILQDGDTIKNKNFQSLLKPHHTEWIHENSSLVSSGLSPLPHSLPLIAAISHTIDTTTSIEEFKLALASDSTWHKALSWEAGNWQKSCSSTMIPHLQVIQGKPKPLN